MQLFSSKTWVGSNNTADWDSHYKNLALSKKQNQCMKVGSKLYYCCKYSSVPNWHAYVKRQTLLEINMYAQQFGTLEYIAMTLNLPLIYWFWFVEYCQTSPNKKPLTHKKNLSLMYFWVEVLKQIACTILGWFCLQIMLIYKTELS